MSSEYDKSAKKKKPAKEEDRGESRERHLADSAAAKLGERSAAAKQGERELADSAAAKLGERSAAAKQGEREFNESAARELDEQEEKEGPA